MVRNGAAPRQVDRAGRGVGWPGGDHGRRGQRHLLHGTTVSLRGGGRGLMDGRAGMFGIHDLGAFLAASFLLWLTPGPDTMYILGRSIGQGRRAGVMSALGIGSGLLIHTFLAAFGLAAILAASAWAFVAVKTAGAVYLVYLGVQALRKKVVRVDGPHL